MMARTKQHGNRRKSPLKRTWARLLDFMDRVGKAQRDSACRYG